MSQAPTLAKDGFEFASSKSAPLNKTEKKPQIKKEDSQPPGHDKKFKVEDLKPDKKFKVEDLKPDLASHYGSEGNAASRSVRPPSMGSRSGQNHAYHCTGATQMAASYGQTHTSPVIYGSNSDSHPAAFGPAGQAQAPFHAATQPQGGASAAQVAPQTVNNTHVDGTGPFVKTRTTVTETFYGPPGWH